MVTTSYQNSTTYYMSGTGNSHRVATWLAETASKAGALAQVLPIADADPAQQLAGPTHLLGLAFPTHGFTAPWAMIRFALRLPRRRGMHALVTPTRAGTRAGSVYLPGLEGTAGYLLALILLLKGYNVRGVFALDMPSNWIVIHPALSPSSVEGIISRARGKADRFMARILSGQRYLGGRISLFLGLLLLPISIGYLLMGRFFLAKLFFANERCNDCGLCVQYCPHGALRMWGRDKPRPFWTYSCESCMRCISFCPQKAVEAGHSWGVLLYFVASVPAVDYFLQWLPGLSRLNTGLVAWLLDYPYKLISLALAYLIFTLLIRIPPVNRLFTWTSLTHYYRRYREPGTKLKDLKRHNVQRYEKKEPA